MATNYPVNPRVRAFGKARIDIAQRAKDPEDWERLWVQPSNPFPFTWGEAWKQSVEYKVDDFAAEVGFYTDVLGLPVNALDPDYAMFTSPGGEFFLSVIPTPAGEVSTPPDAIRLQFMLADIFATTRELEKRGIVFEQPPQPCQSGSTLYICSFRTPHGICTDLWGMVTSNPVQDVDRRLPDQDLPISTWGQDGELKDDGKKEDRIGYDFIEAENRDLTIIEVDIVPGWDKAETLDLGGNGSENGGSGPDDDDEEDDLEEDEEENGWDGFDEDDEDDLDDDEDEIDGNLDGDGLEEDDEEDDLDEDEYEEENLIEKDEADEDLDADKANDLDEDDDTSDDDEDDDDLEQAEADSGVFSTHQVRNPSISPSSHRIDKPGANAPQADGQKTSTPRYVDIDAT